MNNDLKAIEIFNYCCDYLAEGVNIDKQTKKEMIKEIKFMLETN